MSYNKHQVLLPECLKIKKAKKQPQQQKKDKLKLVQHCLIKVVYTLKAAHRGAVIHIIKALRKDISNLPCF